MSLLKARLGETVTAVKGRRGSPPIPCRSSWIRVFEAVGVLDLDFPGVQHSNGVKHSDYGRPVW